MSEMYTQKDNQQRRVPVALLESYTYLLASCHWAPLSTWRMTLPAGNWIRHRYDDTVQRQAMAKFIHQSGRIHRGRPGESDDSLAEYVPARPRRHDYRLVAISWLDPECDH